MGSDLCRHPTLACSSYPAASSPAHCSCSVSSPPPIRPQLESHIFISFNNVNTSKFKVLTTNLKRKTDLCWVRTKSVGLGVEWHDVINEVLRVFFLDSRSGRDNLC